MKHFSWDKYLEETNSLPAPARAFKVVRLFNLHFGELEFKSRESEWIN